MYQFPFLKINFIKIKKEIKYNLTEKEKLGERRAKKGKIKK